MGDNGSFLSGFGNGLFSSLGPSNFNLDLAPLDPSMDPSQFAGSGGNPSSPEMSAYKDYFKSQNLYNNYDQATPPKRSWFMNMLSGGILGMAGGAGAPDPATGFARGYAAVMQQRQQELQQAQYEEKLRQQQYTQEAQRAKDFMDVMERRQKMEYYPAEIQAKMREADSQFINAMQGSGYVPDLTAPETPEGADAAMKQTDGQPWNYMSAINGGMIHAWKADPSKLTQADSTFDYGDGNTITIPAGSPVTDLEKARDNYQKYLNDQADRLQKTQQYQAEIIGRQNVANTGASAQRDVAQTYASRPLGSAAQPGNLTEEQQKQYQYFQGELGNVRKQAAAIASQIMQRPALRTMITKNADGTYAAAPGATPDVVAIIKQINALKLQESQFNSQIQGLIGAGQPQTQGGPYDPFAVR